MVYLHQYLSRIVLLGMLLTFLISTGDVSGQSGTNVIGRVDYCSAQAGEGNYRTQEYYQFLSVDGRVRDLYTIDTIADYSVCRHIYSESSTAHVYYALGTQVRAVSWSELVEIQGTAYCLNALFDPNQAPIGVLNPSTDGVELSALDDLIPVVAGDLLRPAWHGAFPQPGIHRVEAVPGDGHSFTFSVDFEAVAPAAGGPLNLNQIEETNAPADLAWLRDSLYDFYADALGDNWHLADYQDRCGEENPCVDDRLDIRITFEAVERPHLIQLRITPNIMVRRGMLDVVVVAVPDEGTPPGGLGVLAGADFSPMQVEAELARWGNPMAEASGLGDNWRAFVLQNPERENFTRLWVVTRPDPNSSYETDMFEDVNSSGEDILCDPTTFLPEWTLYVR